MDDFGLKATIDGIGFKTIIDEILLAMTHELVQDAIATSTSTAKDNEHFKHLVAKIKETLDNKSIDM